MTVHRSLSHVALKTLMASFGLASMAFASAQEFGGIKLPANYYTRFNEVEAFASPDAGFGVSFLPLPIDPDVRVSLVKRQKYLEYNLTYRNGDSRIAMGVFKNPLGIDSSRGVDKIEIGHTPQEGPQLYGLLQSPERYSQLSGGYAFKVADKKVRIALNAGIAAQEITRYKSVTESYQVDFAEPFVSSDIGYGYGMSVGENVTFSFGIGTRAIYFPIQKSYQLSADINPIMQIRPSERLMFDINHLERFTYGSIPVADLNLGRYEETKFTTSYRTALNGDFNVGMLRSRVVKNWRGNSGNTYLYNDFLLNVPKLPVMVGPSVGYQWTNKGNSWMISLSSEGK